MKKLIILICLVFSSIVLFTKCQPSSSSGKVLFQVHCANCHMNDGKGLGELYPDLNTSSLINSASLEIACIIQNGILADEKETARFEQYNMPPNQQLSETDIANILNYLQKNFSTQPSTYNFQEVKKVLNRCN